MEVVHGPRVNMQKSKTYREGSISSQSQAPLTWSPPIQPKKNGESPFAILAALPYLPSIINARIFFQVSTKHCNLGSWVDNLFFSYIEHTFWLGHLIILIRRKQPSPSYKTTNGAPHACIPDFSQAIVGRPREYVPRSLDL